MDENSNMPALSQEQAQMIPVLIQHMMGPLIEAMGQMLKNNTDALNQLASTQQIQADRLEALEKQIRLNTPVTPKQVKFLNDAIRARARELLDKRGVDDKKAMTKLGTAIRKALLARYGVAAPNEIPKHEYSVAQNYIATWNDMLTVRDVVKEARDRAMPKEEEA